MVAPHTRLASCSAALSLLLSPGPASAGAPTGSFEFELGGTNSLWMGGGVDTHEDADGFCASLGEPFDSVELCDYELRVDGKGRISGHMEFVGWLDDAVIALEGPIKGAQRGNNRTGATRTSFVIQLTGSAIRHGVWFETRVSQKLVAQIDAAGVMTGTWTHKTCIEGDCETSRSPAGPSTWSNGHWTLELDVELITFGGSELGRASFTAGGLGGVARIRFGDDTLCDFAVGGQYDFNEEVADLSLTPTSAKCMGGSLRLRSLVKGPSTQNDSAYVGLLDFKLFGVNGTTGVHSGYPTIYRNRLENLFFVDDPSYQFVPTPSGSGSAGSGAMMTVTIIQGPPGALGQPTASSAANGASASVTAMGVPADFAAFDTLQSGARLELVGLEARPIGPVRPVLDAAPADPLVGSPPSP